MKFRYDINALRAISIIGVVLFHFFPTYLPGGFAGVDVFFVISGYLMASICLPKIQSNKFEFGAFYIARCRRILPALIVFCAFVLAFNWFNLAPLKYAELAEHTLSSLLFLSNISYWLEFGYFDGFTKSKWLLHTWSLSVEWQFYLIYPLFLYTVYKLMPTRYVKSLILFITLAFCIFTILVVTKKPTASFYLLPTRAWELLIGTIVFLYPVQLALASKTKLTLVGVLLILVSFISFDSTLLWPSVWTIIPVLGACFVLYGQSNQLKLFQNPVVNYIGTRSYSLYLWHWFFAVYCFTQGETGIWALLIGIVLATICAELSFRYIESSILIRQSSTAVLFVWLLVCVSSAAIIYLQGVPSRAEKDLTKLTANMTMPHRENGYCFQDFDQQTSKVEEVEKNKCVLGDVEKEPSILLFGDSFAGHNEPFWHEYGLANKVSVQVVTTNWCSPSVTERFIWHKSHIAYDQCMINRNYVKTNIQNYNAIVVAGAWSTVKAKGQLADIYEFIEYALSQKTNIVVMPSPPSFDINVLDYFKDAYSFGRDLNYDTLPNNSNFDTTITNNEIKQYFESNKFVFVIPQISMFSMGSSFKYEGVDIPYSLDGSHISITGSKQSFLNFKNSNYYNELNKFIFKE